MQNLLARRTIDLNSRYVILNLILQNWWLYLAHFPSDEWYWTLLMKNQNWLGVIKEQANTRANVDPDLCRHMASSGHNELTKEDMK